MLVATGVAAKLGVLVRKGAALQYASEVPACLPICLPICVSAGMPVCLPFNLSVFLHACLPRCLPVLKAIPFPVHDMTAVYSFLQSIL